MIYTITLNSPQDNQWQTLNSLFWGIEFKKVNIGNNQYKLSLDETFDIPHLTDITSGRYNSNDYLKFISKEDFKKLLEWYLKHSIDRDNSVSLNSLREFFGNYHVGVIGIDEDAGLLAYEDAVELGV